MMGKRGPPSRKHKVKEGKRRKERRRLDTHTGNNYSGGGTKKKKAWEGKKKKGEKSFSSYNLMETSVFGVTHRHSKGKRELARRKE